MSGLSLDDEEALIITLPMEGGAPRVPSDVSALGEDSGEVAELDPLGSTMYFAHIHDRTAELPIFDVVPAAAFAPASTRDAPAPLGPCLPPLPPPPPVPSGYQQPARTIPLPALESAGLQTSPTTPAGGSTSHSQ
jgi:hypothetical protein